MPGLLISFAALTGESRGVVKIPTRCLISSKDDGYRVFVAERTADGSYRARLRSVETALISGDEIEILSGLSEGELVVQFGQTLLNDGDIVKIVRGGEGM